MIDQVHRVVADIAIPVQGLRIGDGTGHQVGRGESAEAVNVVPGHRVVVARLGVAFVAGELPLRPATALVPRLAVWEVALLSEDRTVCVRGHPHREMIGVLVFRRPAFDGRQGCVAGVDVFAVRQHLPVNL